MAVKKFSWCLLFLLVCLMTSCHKENISEQLIGTWKTDWNDDLKKPLKKMQVNEGISFFPDLSQKDTGKFESAFIGSVDYKDKKGSATIEFFITVPGTWMVKDGNNLILHYDIVEMDIAVSHEKQNLNITGTIGSVASDIFSGNWGGAVDKVIGTVTSGDINGKMDSEAKSKLSDYFRELLVKRNKEKITYEDVEIEDVTMVCDPGGIFSDKITFYKTDNEPVHLINEVVSIEEAEKQEETTNAIEELNSNITDVIGDLDSTITNYLEDLDPAITNYLEDLDIDF